MKRIILFLFIVFTLFLLSYSQFLNEKYNFNNFSTFLSADSSSYTFSSGFLFNNNYKLSYSLLNAKYSSKLNDNLILNYGFGFLNYNLKENILLSNIGLTYKRDNFSISLEVGRTLQKE